MCGRFVLDTSEEVLKKRFPRLQSSSAPFAGWRSRYNIAPSQEVLILPMKPDGPFSARWGLIPSWAKDSKMASKMINARSETAAEKPSFRKSFQSKRCLIPATGFYEWTMVGEQKQPHYFYLKSKTPFAFAGLYEEWKSPEGEIIASTTILTKAASPSVRPFHDRMPCILQESAEGPWLDSETPSNQLNEILNNSCLTELVQHPVSRQVNSPKNDSADLIKALA